MDSKNYRLVELAGGGCSVHSVAHRETFHPVVGPVAEAEALYVEQLRLPERMRGRSTEFVVWDIGLGAAANVLTVLRATREIACPVRMVSFDQTLEPLGFALAHADKLAYFDRYEEPCRRLVQSGGPVCFQDGSRTIVWELHLGDFPGLLGSNSIQTVGKPEAILFDPYSPARNPAMWTLPLFERLFRVLDPLRPCNLATYSRSTLLRVTLCLAGFFVGRGRATGEKEETTIASNAAELIAEPLGERWLERARNSTSAEPLREPAYRQGSMSSETWERLRRHPQFR